MTNNLQKSSLFLKKQENNNVSAINLLLIVGAGATFGQKSNLSALYQELFRRVSAALQPE